MSRAMDASSLSRNGGERKNNNHEAANSSPVGGMDRMDQGMSTSVVDVDEDVGENSNGSSSEGSTASSNGKNSSKDLFRHRNINRVRKASGGGRGGCSTAASRISRQSGGSSHHNNRANYCQFETPADESRGTFPDDFDEEMFINSSTGQLVESRNEAPKFDEEMDETNSNPPNLNLVTADHSESSDIEESMDREEDIYPLPVLKREVPTPDPCSTPTSSRSSGKVSTARKSQLNSTPPPSALQRSSCGLRIFSTIPISTASRFRDSVVLVDVKRPAQTNDKNYSTQIDLRKIIQTEINEKAANDKKKCLLVDESYSQEEEDEDCNHEESEPSTSNSVIRKRKFLPEEPKPTPAKKAVKDSASFSGNLVGIHGIGCQVLNRDVDDDDIDEPQSPSSVDLNPALMEWLNTFAGWGPFDRRSAINQLIQSCEAAEVRHMMKIIEPQFQRDFISLLPKELALYVLSFLEPKDLLQAAQTCRYWRILCDDSLLWKEKCREAGVGPFSAMSQRISNRNRGKGNNSLGTLAGSPMCPGAGDNNCISSCEPWKAAYLRQHNVEMNWRFQPIRPAKTLKGHDDHVITCLQFSSNRIVSGSDDNTLKVWSAITGKCLRTLVGHTGGVWSSQMSGITIVSGSTDRTLRVWNADTGACLHTLYGHTSTVRCMHLYERKVVSGSRDATLRVWNVDSGECLHVLVGHMAAVRCVQYNGKIVVSGAYDFMVRVWDVEREECLHELRGHTNRVYSLQFDGIHVVSGSLDTSIRVWDVQTGTCRHTLMGHQSLTSGMELRDNLLVSGNADSTVKIWDINTGQCLLTLSGPNKHLSAVTCLQLINKFVITSSDDGTVKLWDISTGEFVRNLVTLSSGGSGGVVWRIRASETKLVCAVGSRNGTEETKLLVLDFDIESANKQEEVTKDLMKDASTSMSPMKCA